MRQIPLLLVAVCILGLTPAMARADLPPVGNSTIPTHVVLVGLGPAGSDSVTGSAVVTVRDFANNPVPGSVVVFDFSACTDMAIATDQRDPRLSENCGSRTVAAVTDANGIARLTVLGTCTNGPPSGPGSFKIFADGVLLGSPRLSALERDGANGLTLADLSYWTADFFSTLDPMRADLNGDGYVSIIDLSTWAGAYFNGANTEPIGTVCP